MYNAKMREVVKRRYMGKQILFSRIMPVGNGLIREMGAVIDMGNELHIYNCVPDYHKYAVINGMYCSTGGKTKTEISPFTDYARGISNHYLIPVKHFTCMPNISTVNVKIAHYLSIHEAEWQYMFKEDFHMILNS